MHKHLYILINANMALINRLFTYLYAILTYYIRIFAEMLNWHYDCKTIADMNNKSTNKGIKHDISKMDT